MSKALYLRNWEHCWDLSKCFPLLTWNKDSKIWRSEVKGVLLNFLWRLGSKSMVTMTAENTFSTFYCEDLAHSLSRRVPKGLDSGFTHFSNIITLCHIRFLLFSLFFLLSFFFFKNVTKCFPDAKKYNGKNPLIKYFHFVFITSLFSFSVMSVEV